MAGEHPERGIARAAQFLRLKLGGALGHDDVSGAWTAEVLDGQSLPSRSLRVHRRRPSKGHVVVLKVLKLPDALDTASTTPRPDLRSAVLHELRLQSGMDHRHLVCAFETCMRSGYAAIVMPHYGQVRELVGH